MRRAIYQLYLRGASSRGKGKVQLEVKSSSAKFNWSSKIATRCKRRLISAVRQVQLEAKNSRARLLPGMSRGALIIADGAARLATARQLLRMLLGLAVQDGEKVRKALRGEDVVLKTAVVGDAEQQVVEVLDVHAVACLHGEQEDDAHLF